MLEALDANGVNGHLMRPRVLVPEKLSADGLTLLRHTLKVDERQHLTPEDLLNTISDYDALVIRSETRVTAELLAAGKKLKVVARAGVGVVRSRQFDMLLARYLELKRV